MDGLYCYKENMLQSTSNKQRKNGHKEKKNFDK